MSYRIELHPAVRADHERIFRSIADFAGEASARRKLGEIRKSVESLAEAPHRSSVRPDILPGFHAIPAGRRAVVGFVIDEGGKTVRVLAVVYAGADWEARLKTRL